MVNTQIRQFREAIISQTNESELPIEVKRLVFVEIMQQIQETADSAIRNEIAQSMEDSEKEGAEDAESIQPD